MMEATAQNTTAAYLVGIRVRDVYTLTWGASAALAGAAAVLMAPLTLLTPDIGLNLLLKAFAATILGGLGSMPGALVGGFIVGVSESLAGGYIDTAFQEVSSFIVIIVVLVLRPTGLFGARAVRRA
jgi:branched-chain amino acid transport system permease protein